MLIKTLAKTGLFLLSLSLSQLAFSQSPKKILDIHHWSVKGTPVYFVQTEQPQLVDVRVAFNAGAARDGSQYGLAMLTNAMIDQGSETLNVDEIAESFAKHGAIYINNVDRDMAIFGFRSLTINTEETQQEDNADSNNSPLAQVLDIFTNIIATPTFPEAEFERNKQLQLTQITYDSQSPQSIASRTFFETIYHNHPYGHSIHGNRLTVEAIKLENVKDFYNQYYGAKNAVIAIVGPIDQEQAKAISEKIVTALPKGQAAKPLPSPKQAQEKTINHVDFASTQTIIAMGQPTITYQSANFYPLIVANNIFGGGGVLTSRLSQIVREEHGLSYTIGSGLSPMLVDGPFTIYLATANSQVEEALNLVNSTLQDYREIGPTEAELNAAKQYISGSFPLQFDNNRAIVNTILTLGYYELPLNYLDNYLDNINSVSIEQAQQAFHHHIDPDKMTTIIVGSR